MMNCFQLFLFAILFVVDKGQGITRRRPDSETHAPQSQIDTKDIRQTPATSLNDQLSPSRKDDDFTRAENRETQWQYVNPNLWTTQYGGSSYGVKPYNPYSQEQQSVVYQNSYQQQQVYQNPYQKQQQQQQQQVYQNSYQHHQQPLYSSNRYNIDSYSYEETLFGPGDVPHEWKNLIHNNPLTSFNGRWEIIVYRSDSLEEILAALGLPPFKRRIMENFQAQTDISVVGSDSVFMQNHLPANIVVGTTIPLGGQPFVYQENETGTWTSQASFVNGRIGQIRTSQKGTMYDVRAVFNRDPEGIYSGSEPLMLFRWTFIPAGTSRVYTCNRWLRHIA